MFGRKKHTLLNSPEMQQDDQQPRLAPRSPSEAIKPMAAPPPPPAHPPQARRHAVGRSGLLTLFVAIAVALVFGFSMLEREVTAQGPLAADKVVVIPRNTGTSEIADILKREGVITQPLLFETYALFNRRRGQLKAGEFQFKAGTSIETAIDTLVEGKAILHSITIPEGLTSEQIMSRLFENEILTGEVAETPREGTLLPDTYKFERGMTRQQIINAMQAAHRQILAQIWQRRSPELPVKTAQELVILASIVEKETGRADERTRVAGVFINRLMKRMKLQSDPTIVYGLVGGKGTLGPRDHAQRDRDGDALQHLRDRGPAARADRQSRPRRARSGRQPVAHQGPLFRRRRLRRARLRGDLRSAPAQRGALAAAREGEDRAGPERCRPDRSRGGYPHAADARPGRWRRTPRSRGGRPRGFDASEGTDKDPLKNKTFDLNTPKNVPALKQP